MNKISTDCFTKDCKNKTLGLYCIECLSKMVVKGDTIYFVGL